METEKTGVKFTLKIMVHKFYPNWPYALKSHYRSQFKLTQTKIFQIYCQKILVRKLLSWSLVKITKNYKILVLLGLGLFFCEGIGSSVLGPQNARLGTTKC